MHLAGFRSFPEVGQPLYACQTHEDALFMINRIKTRRERELTQSLIDKSQPMQEMKKRVKGLTRMEKRKLYGGDKTIMYEKMGLVEESDIEKYRKKLGLSKDIDLLSLDVDDLELLLDEQAVEEGGGFKSKRNSFFKRRLKDFNKEELKKILAEFKEERRKL